MVTIKTIISKRFFSGDINLVGNQEKSLVLENLSKTQLLDIIEAESNRHLIVSDIDLIKEAYKNLTSIPKFDDTDLRKRITIVEDTIDNLTVGQVSSVMFWDSTEW